MQHQSQEHHQPHSSEFVPFEQPQAYQPQPPVYVPPYQQSAQEMPQFSAQGQEQIVIYPNRGQIIGRSVPLAIFLLLFLLLFAAPFLILIMNDPSGASDYALFLIIPLLSVVACVPLYAWLIWSMLSMIYPEPKPMLIINNEGIRVNKMPMQDGFFIAWSEIEKISSASFMYKYICISPKNADQYLSRLNLFDRLNRRFNSLFLGSPLYFPQVFMSRPVDEVIHQIYTQYWPQLNHNRIRLHQ